LLSKGDQAKSEKKYKAAEDFYLQSAHLVEAQATTLGDKNYALMCAHSHETLADLYTNFMQEQGKALKHSKLAVDYCNMEGIHVHMPAFKAKIMCLCYYGYTVTLSLLPNRDYFLMLKNLDLAWQLAPQCNDKDDMKRKVIYMYIAIYNSTKQLDLVKHWNQQLQILLSSSSSGEKQEQQQGMVYIQRLMDIEQNINHTTASAQVIKAAQLFNDSRLLNPEFAASVAGQIIYYHRLYASLKLEDGIQWGERALEILRPMYGEKHGVIRNVYLSLSDVYSRLGNYEKAQEYKTKMLNSQKEMGM